MIAAGIARDFLIVVALAMAIVIASDAIVPRVIALLGN